MHKCLLAALLVMLLTGCNRGIGHVQKTVPHGDAEAGRQAIIAYGCGSCHVIPDVSESYVGPPLGEYAQRHYVAGNLPNTADNLIEWIQNPQAIEPGTAMPNLNVTEIDARNMAAYLYSK